MAGKPEETNKVKFEEEASSDVDAQKGAPAEGADRPHKCPFCEAAFPRPQGLKRHLRKHLNEEEFKCTHCDASFPGPGKLKKHLKNHEEEGSPLAAQLSEPEDSDRDTGKPAGQKSHKCPQCDAAFAVKMNLKKHVGKFHAGEEFLQGTSSCGVNFPEREALRVHNKTHLGQKSHKCSLCEASFAHPRGLKKHMATHGGDMSSPYTTFTCGGPSQRHVITHTLETPHYCTPYHTPFSYGEFGNAMSNAIDKPYGCNLCGSAFAEPGKLKQHVLAHSGSLMASAGEKPFRCAVCDAAFSRKGELTAHRKKQHAEGGTPERGLGDSCASDDQSKEAGPSSELDVEFINLSMK